MPITRPLRTPMPARRVAPPQRPRAALQQVRPMPSLVKPAIKPAIAPVKAALPKPQVKSPRSAFATEEGYQKYLARQKPPPPPMQQEPNPAAAPWINIAAPPGETQAPAKPPPAVKPPVQPAQPTATAPPVITEVDATSEADQIKKQSEDDLNELNALKGANLTAESDYRDAMVQSSKERYSAEQANLDRLEALQATTLDARNKALQAGADVQRKDAENAWQTSKQEYDLQRDRTKKAYEDQIVEQQLSNTKRTLEMESTLAAMGGYGSLAKNKEMQSLTLQNDRVLNSVVFEKEASDREVTIKIDDLTRGYKQDLNKIETNKQNAIQDNYDKYLEYVTKIQDDREMSEVEKQSAIRDAQGNYKRNVAKINQDSFETRYNISQTAAAQVHQARAQEKEDAKNTIKDIINTFALSEQEMTPAQQKQLQMLEKRSGYPVGLSLVNLDNLKKQAKAENLQISQITDNAGNVTFVAMDKTTGEIKHQETLEGLGASTKFTLNFNPITGETTIFDPSTGQAVSPGSSGVAQSYFKNTPAGNTSVGTSMLNNDDFKKIFNVGGVGGWCGIFASSLSTATQVGNTWGEKRSHIDKRDNPKPGDKLLIPLGVKTDRDYGHVAVVTDYDAASGTISVVESNKDGAINKCQRQGGKNCESLGKITTGTYKLSDVVKQGGGFASGSFKPGIQNQLKSKNNPILAQQSTRPSLTYSQAYAEGLKRYPDDPSKAQTFAKNVLASGSMPPEPEQTITKEQAAKQVTKGVKPEKPQKPPTEAEKTTAIFAQRTKEANQIFDQLADKIEGQDFTAFQYQRSVPNVLKSSEMQQQEQAERNFINSILRRESGAAIAPSEFDSAAKQYFPQPGDGKEVLRQKKQNRLTTIKGLERAAGPALFPEEATAGEPTGLQALLQAFTGGGAQPSTVQPTGAANDILAKYGL